MQVIKKGKSAVFEQFNDPGNQYKKLNKTFTLDTFDMSYSENIEGWQHLIQTKSLKKNSFNLDWVKKRYAKSMPKTYLHSNKKLL